MLVGWKGFVEDVHPSWGVIGLVQDPPREDIGIGLGGAGKEEGGRRERGGVCDGRREGETIIILRTLKTKEDL